LRLFRCRISAGFAVVLTPRSFFNPSVPSGRTPSPSSGETGKCWPQFLLKSYWPQESSPLSRVLPSDLSTSWMRQVFFPDPNDDWLVFRCLFIRSFSICPSTERNVLPLSPPPPFRISFAPSQRIFFPFFPKETDEFPQSIVSLQLLVPPW